MLEPSKLALNGAAKRADAVELYERQAERARVERDKVVRELLSLGRSEREVAWAAGISGPAVHYIKERADV